MTEAIFALVTQYCAWIVLASAFVSCLAVPIPTSLVMLSAGAFVATGDLNLVPVALAAWIGAALGDQTGFLIGRYGGAPLVDRLARNPARQKVLTRARATVDKHGGLGVFLSTSLFAPLGPWVNFVAGTAGMRWPRFAFWDMLGETVWITLYIGLGMAFATQVTLVADMMSNIIGLLAALAVIVAMGLWIRGALRRHDAPKD